MTTLSNSKKQRKRNLARREAITFYLCISPWLIGLVLFVLGPMIASAFFSLTRWDLLSAPKFIGLDNYEKLLTRDPLFWQALKVTAIYTLFYVPLDLAGGLALALLVNQKVRGISVFRTFFYLPSVLAGVAFVVLWMWIFNPEAGLINSLLRLVGIQGPRWLADPATALPALLIMSLWGMGRSMIIFLAGLQGIPDELYDAAAIDGAGTWQKTRHVTLPLLTPTIFFNLVLGIIYTLQSFEASFVVTEGGPAYATWFFGLHIWKHAFDYWNMGYACALAWFFAVIIVAATVVQQRFSSRWVFYYGAE